jgi:FtsP/CotA-like multicopper oxidase with cupredoxin domain
MSRRRFLRLVGGTGAATVGLAAGLPWLAAPAQLGGLVRSELPLPAPFQLPLPVPPVLIPYTDATTDHYELTQRVATQEILPGVDTEIWGYDGIFPGPTIVSRSGRPVVVRQHNLLPVPTVTHLHGGHTPAESDGYPTDLLLPAGMPDAPAEGMAGADPRAVITRGTRTYAYPLRQRAATLWYHDHRMGFTGASVWRGLAGFHLVHDDEEAALPLPRGHRDIPVMITDRAFAADGSLRYPTRDRSLRHIPGVVPGYTQGVLGDVILVNGAPWPVLEAEAVRYRLRLLNASNARRYRLALDPPPPGGAGLVQIGSDGGLLERPVPHDEIEIAPAERFDVIVDLSRYRVGQRVTLVNRLDRGGAGLVMAIQVARRGTDDSRIPDRLARIEPPRPEQADTTRTFVFHDGGDQGWMINGRPFDPSRADANPAHGAVEIWRFISDFEHPIHLHLAHFLVLERGTGVPGPLDGGWKDTVSLRPAERVSVIAQFSDYPGRFVYHCHNLEHEDMAMMANFEVADPR